MFYYTCFTNVSGVFNYTKLLDNSEYALHFMSLEQQEGKGYNTFTINHVRKENIDAFNALFTAKYQYSGTKEINGVTFEAYTNITTPNIECLKYSSDDGLYLISYLPAYDNIEVVINK